MSMAGIISLDRWHPWNNVKREAQALSCERRDANDTSRVLVIPAFV